MTRNKNEMALVRRDDVGAVLEEIHQDLAKFESGKFFCNNLMWARLDCKLETLLSLGLINISVYRKLSERLFKLEPFVVS